MLAAAALTALGQANSSSSSTSLTMLQHLLPAIRLVKVQQGL
jgi:hypothetical protein